MKKLILVTVSLLLSSCTSYVVVKHSTCESVAGDIYKCEQVK